MRIVIGLFIVFMYLLIYSLCVIAKRADEHIYD